MTSLKLKIFLLISAALILPRSVQGHDGWIQVNPDCRKGPAGVYCAHARQPLQRTWKFSSRRQMGCAVHEIARYRSVRKNKRSHQHNCRPRGRSREDRTQGSERFSSGAVHAKNRRRLYRAGSTGAKPATRGRAQTAHDEKRQIGIRCAGQSEGRRGTKGERLRENLCAEQSFGDRPGEQSFQHD